METALRSSDPPAVAVPEGRSTNPVPPVTDDAALTDSAELIAAAVIHLVRQFGAIKARVTTGPEGDHSPLYLLVKLAMLGPSRASDLAEQVCADPSTVSRQVASLVKAGLVERRADPADGRASILVPTELGRIRVLEHSKRRGATMRPVIADWSQQDRDELVRLLHKYTEGIEAHREQMISIMLEHHGSAAEHGAVAPPVTTSADMSSAVWKETN